MSTRFKVPVTEILMPRLANTAILGLGVLLVMVPLALVLGVLAGMKEGSPQDRAISVFSIATTSVPEFASGVFLVGIFVLWLKWLPGVSNMIRSEEHTSELQSLMRISYAVFCLKKKNQSRTNTNKI